MKMGFEIHIQLNTQQKLFCGCNPGEIDTKTVSFGRKLRVSSSEMGEIDPAAAFEIKKGRSITYVSGDRTSCLVEADEEPPHNPNSEAIKSAIIISNLFSAGIVDEIHFMRKIVVDGSNTSGFQRTAIVGMDGRFVYVENVIGISTICLEEDAGRLVEKGENGPVYNLDRLGVPLLEITTEPVEADAATGEKIAAGIGRTLKLTGLFARGLGTIRQDVNVSVGNYGVVEVKGVQKLEQIRKVLEFEEKRQNWLVEVSRILNERKIREADFDAEIVNLTDLLRASNSQTIQRLLSDQNALALKAPGFSGLFAKEPVPDSRLGLDLADLCKLFGFKGIVHSDEISKYGIENQILNDMSRRLDLHENDGFILIFGDGERTSRCLEMARLRLKQSLNGPPSETRMATDKGATRFLRPRPGASRMYPETDIITILVSDEMKASYRVEMKSWESAVDDIADKYNIPHQVAEQLLDSDYLEWFTEAAVTFKSIPSTVIASVVLQTFEELRKDGIQANKVALFDILNLVSKGSIAKEAIPDVLRESLSQAISVESVIKRRGLSSISQEELKKIVASILKDSRRENVQKEKIYGVIMGRVMKQVRGKIDGMLVDQEVKRQIEEEFRSN
ncbi:MAG: Glu-tRNA(Gln) amidotransferase subunit GatE [Nitrososphaerota archaeon]|jgi:glutamyl-tRNA(Gln) amidotransferase subunit E|nr:Glu-tRNA(Gln) amidotransferase subunit GatE [Nitrososphaerota archaeon]MDG6932486.1 Glu-tRNA(Gln) amidotransferase subunit GatE [Nitrososphaerota archaeon]MDG6936233.1 Glu-tRNA(Gln) amidotransferase subunit GatE [Nitrososphaerota archaeon]MDG6944961.1 Glu-tRNA(Gln) amidotransferase subunit GatE [Nitrososphaerota archaeon]